MKRHKVTMQDVAKDAGVSVATVSRVINNNKAVKPMARKCVLDSMENLAYVPNYAARNLKMNTSTTIGFMVSDISNSYYVSVARAIEDVVANYNYNLTMCSTQNDKERELRYLRLFLSQNVAALILNPTNKNYDFIIEMNQHIPILLINRRVTDERFIGDYVGGNNYKGSYLITKQLLSLGHRRIFVIHGPRGLSNTEERLQGFVGAMKEFGIDADDNYPYFFENEYTIEGGYAGVEYMSMLPEMPSALICHNNMLTLGALRCCDKKRIRAPEDISIASFDTMDMLDLIATRPTVAAYDTQRMGIIAGNAALERILNPLQPNREFIIEPQIIHGNAVGVLTEKQ